MYGRHNRFDHNNLAGKKNKGVTMSVRLNTQASQQNYHRIDHNYFGPRQIPGSNGGETLRIGAVLIMATILFCFQTSIGNVQTLPSDFLGEKSVGSLAGYAGMAAKLAAGAMIYSVHWLTTDDNYTLVFVIGAGLAVLAMASIWLLCPKIEPLKSKHS
jgi:hypothetical protein